MEGRCNRKKLASRPRRDWGGRLGPIDGPFFGRLFVAQSFLKVAALEARALNGSEPPLAIAQSGVLLFFIFLAVLAVRRFRAAAGTSYAASVDTRKHTSLVSREYSREPADERVGLYSSGSG